MCVGVERVKEKEILVLYVLTKLELGGAQKVCLTLFKGIAEKGLLSGLISGADGVLVSQVNGLENVILLPDFKREVGIKNIISELKAFWAIYRCIKKIRLHTPNLVVHTHSTKAGIFGRWAAFLAGVRVRVHTVHGFGFHPFQVWPVRFFMIALEYLTSFITTHYVCVSEKDRLVGEKLFPRFRQKSSIIRAAVDWDCFYIPARREQVSQNCVIGTVSCFKPQKNLLDLLRAFKWVCDQLSEHDKRRVFLHIVGDGVMRGHLEAFVREHGLTSRIVFRGWQTQVATIMKGWDIFAMSSLWEGLPCAIVEARLSKLPVVCYDVGGITEVIKDGENGFIVHPGDWQTLAKRLHRLVVDEQLRLRMINYKENLIDFKNSSMIQEHVFLYKNL